MGVRVLRGANFLTCNDAIEAAAIADPAARHDEREAARQRRNGEAVRAAMGKPDRIALVTPPQ